MTFSDDEGDEITISSDNELIIALTEMKTDIKKLYINTLGRALQKVEEKSDKEFSVCNVVICDGCDKVIEGNRYKCVLSRDYDLCSSCQSKSVHQDHPTLAIFNKAVCVTDKISVEKIVSHNLLSYLYIDGQQFFRMRIKLKD